MTTTTNLYGLYVRSAERASDAEVQRWISALEAEPEPHHPHVAQALAAFKDEAKRRGEDLTRLSSGG